MRSVIEAQPEIKDKVARALLMVGGGVLSIMALAIVDLFMCIADVKQDRAISDGVVLEMRINLEHFMKVNGVQYIELNKREGNSD